MLDSQGRNGGSSDVKQVGISNDNSCLDRSSPSSTAGPSSTTSDAMPTRAGATSPSATSTHGVSAGIIIGAIAGGLILIAVLGGLVYFFLRKQNPRRHPRSDIDLSFEPTGATSRVYPYPISSSTNLTRPYAPPDSVPIAEYEPRPFILPPRDPEPLSYAQSRHSRTNSQSELLSPGPSDHSGPPRTFTSTAQRKAAMAGLTAYKPSRFILHTDLDEEPHDEEVIELPPQYSENRRPLEIVDSHATHSPPPTQPPPDHTTPGSS
jgi:hypothetical protein